MILYVVGVAFAIGLAAGAGGLNWWHSAADARREAALVKAQAEVDALAIKAQTEAANKVIDMTAAFEAGESKAKVVYRTIEKRGADYVASAAVFNLPECRIPIDGVRLLSSARTGVPIAAVAGSGNAAVPGAGAAARAGNDNGGTVPAQPAGPSAVGGMPTQNGATGSPGALPAGGTGRLRPKPKAID